MGLRQAEKRLGRWLERGSPLLIGIFWPLLLLGFFCLLFPSFGSVLSTAGTLVQLSGFALILRGIRRIADIFEEQPLHRRVWNWIRDLKEVWNPSPVVGQGSTAIGSAMALDAEASVSYRDAETLEERISVLEIKVENLKKGHDALRKMAKKRLNSLESKIDELEEEHKSGREEILDNLEEIAAGGLDWEFVAVVWLALGLILRSLSPWV